MLSAEHYALFHEQGYVIVPDFIGPTAVAQAKARFEPLFRGEFESGVQPDEWNWRTGVSPETLTRQICNGWKSDRMIARLVLSKKVGKACARLMGWPGVRINQDNVIWKSPRARALGFHQDDAYQNWIEPPSMVTCWMALDDTRKEGGTIEYVRNSHHWPVQTRQFEFHAPQDYHQGLKYAAEHLGIDDYKIDALEVRAGDAVFHHGRTWHGSGENTTDSPRRSVVAHCMSSQAKFHPINRTPIYSRYKRFGDCEMDESFFPIIYRQDGYRSGFLADFLNT